MSEVMDRLETSVVEAATPDGIAFAKLRGLTQVTVSLAPGYYAHATDARVADKLATLGKLLWVARMKEYYRLKSEYLGREVRGEGSPTSDQQRARREARNNIVATGASDDGTVSASAVGLLNWVVTVAPGTVGRVDEPAFLASCSQAAERLVEDHLLRLRIVWAARY